MRIGLDRERPVAEALDVFELREKLRACQDEDDGRSARAFWTTALLLVAAFATSVLIENLFVRIPLVFVLALIYARIFALFHDADHGAFLRRQRRKRTALRVAAYALLSPPAIWREGHAEHHRGQGAFDAGLAGEYPVWTVDHWHEASPARRFLYRTTRAPATIASAYVTVFLFGSCLLPFAVNPWRNARCLIAPLVHGAIIAALVLLFGWDAALAAFILPAALAAALGAYLIYVQHNAPGVIYVDAEERDGVAAALRSTTYFEMNRVMRWATANIGYHNVHHLAPRIPFYRLPEAHRALAPVEPFLVRTSWRWMDVRAALAANLYDVRRRRMTTYAEAEERVTPPPRSPFFDSRIALRRS
ncbi:MAG: fatty acid desaturase [Parvularculaceae bacterium]|nr:fatty acid desaturase [Parvularculaceae bacterium]